MSALYFRQKSSYFDGINDRNDLKEVIIALHNLTKKNQPQHSALKLEKVQFQKFKKTLFAFSKMPKNQFLAPEKSLKLPQMQF